MGNKNTLTDKEIEVLKIAVHWFMEAAGYLDEFNVQKIKGFSDEYWKIDDALYGVEMLLDKLTGGRKEVIEYVSKEWEFYHSQGKYNSLQHARNTAEVKYEEWLASK